MMQKFRMMAGSVAAGTGAVRAMGDTQGPYCWHSLMALGNQAGRADGTLRPDRTFSTSSVPRQGPRHRILSGVPAFTLPYRVRL